jgi:oligopeptide transport system permease protein
MSDQLDTQQHDDREAAQEAERAAQPRLRSSDELADAASAEQVSGPTSLWADGWRVLKKSPLFWLSLVIIVAMVIMAVFPQAYLWFYDGDPNTRPTACSLSYSVNNPNAPAGGRPSATNWFGFNIQGCDMYTHTILGARISIFIGVIVTVFALIIALIFGTLAGFYGGVLDAIIARITDIWFAIPTILGGIVLLSVLQERGMWQVAFVLTIFGWPSMLRLMRSQVIAGKEADFVTASRSLGASDLRLMVRHILPNGITPVIVYATIFVGVIITAEAALSFLGVGVQIPAISWGLMISVAQDRILQAPHLLLFPGAALAITVFGFLVMGDVLRDAFDPKGR